MPFDYETLIFDRDYQDIDEYETARDNLLNGNISTEYYQAFINASKGTYNATDFQRVCNCIKDLVGLYQAKGIDISISSELENANFTRDTVPNKTLLDEIIEKVKQIYNYINVYFQLPKSYQGLTFEEANTIENILYIAHETLPNLQIVYSGEFYCGEV